MSFQGINFTAEMRKMVVNVKHFFDDFKSTYALDNSATKLASEALGIS